MIDQDKKGLVIVVSAPSGAGKTSVLSMVFKRYPEIKFSVSVTTRPPREGECNGVDYHFVNDETFSKMIENGEFAEWAVVYGNRYGTLKKTLEETIASEDILILDTDTVGAFSIKSMFPEAVLVFIVPPSPDVLKERLAKRNTESHERIAKRIADAPKEVSRMNEYDYIIINEKLEDAAEKFCSIIDAEKQKTERMQSRLTIWRRYLNG